MNTKEAFLYFVAIVVAGAVLFSPAACTINRHNQISKAIQAGANPIEAKCAIESENGMSPLCLAVVTKK